MTKILFVCHGNICRSPMAEFIIKDMVKREGLEQEFEIASAATSRDDVAAPSTIPSAESSPRWAFRARAKQRERSSLRTIKFMI